MTPVLRLRAAAACFGAGLAAFVGVQWLSYRDAALSGAAHLSGAALSGALLLGAFASLGRELGERRRAEEEGRRAHAFLDSVVENIPHMVFVKEAAELRFVRFNRAGEELLGYSRSELIGRNDYDFFPRDQADFFTAKDRAVLAEGRLLDIPEETIQTRLQGTRILHTRKVPILDGDGCPRYLLGISEDITRRRAAEAEIRTLNDALRRHAAGLQAANQDLEGFSYSVSHDLRAPLRHIAGFANLLQEHAGAGLDETGRRYLDTIATSVRRMGELIDDLLVFSRMGRAEMRHERVSLDRLLKDVLKDLPPEAAGRRIDWRIGPLPEVQGDPSMLRVVLANLVSNAVKYSGTRPQAVVEIGARGEMDGQAVMCVRDNGVGFDMQYAHKLFGVFQRLHRQEEFEGTGIGLANVRRIVQRHGGRTWAEGEVGRGAAFYFSLPATAQPGEGESSPSRGASCTHR